MLVELVSQLFGTVASLFALLPTIDVLPDISDLTSNSMIVQGFHWLNWFVPVSVLAGMVTAWIGGIMLYNAFIWLRKMVIDVAGLAK